MSRWGELLCQGWRGIRHQAGVVLAGAIVFLLAFLVGVHLFFPTAAVRQWLSGEIAARTPVSVQLSKMSLKPFFTLVGRDVVATYDNRPVMIDALRLKPLWSSLVTGDPGITVEAALLQGTLDASLRRSGDLSLHAAGLKLTDFPLQRETRTLLSGTVVKGELQGSFPARKGSEIRLALEMDNCTLTVMGQPLILGKITLAGNGQGSNLRIATLKTSDGDIGISGTGTLFLAATAAASRINLDLTLRPAASASPNLAALLDLAAKRQADNSYRLKLNGFLGKMTIEPPVAVREQPAAHGEDEAE